jgi:hypothetical protein
MRAALDVRDAKKEVVHVQEKEQREHRKARSQRAYEHQCSENEPGLHTTLLVDTPHHVVDVLMPGFDGSALPT